MCLKLQLMGEIFILFQMLMAVLIYLIQWVIKSGKITDTEDISSLVFDGDNEFSQDFKNLKAGDSSLRLFSD